MYECVHSLIQQKIRLRRGPFDEVFKFLFLQKNAGGEWGWEGRGCWGGL